MFATFSKIRTQRLSRNFSIKIFKRAPQKWEPEVISLNELQNDQENSKLKEKIEKSYSGNGGLGILLVSDIPNIQQVNSKVCNLMLQIAYLPQQELEEITAPPEALHLIGWNYNRLLVEGVNDHSMASFFAYTPFEEKVPLFGKTQEFEPVYPKRFPETRQIMYDSQALIMDATYHLAKHVDFYLEDIFKGKNRVSIQEQITYKTPHSHRLGYHYPINTPEQVVWLGYHMDYSVFTALTPNIWYNSEGAVEEVDDEEAGLFVMNSQSYEVEKVIVPPNCLAIQAGEALQIFTGGQLVATPHGVEAPKNRPDLGRAVNILFMMAGQDTPMSVPEGRKPEDAYLRDDHPLYQHTHLRERWIPGQTGLEFFNQNNAYFYS